MVSLLHRAIRGEKLSSPPFWFMRQAGRYLPEYRELRVKAKSFLNLCYTPDWAAEVTLQPIRRFDMSAAIIFSDILVVPHAMGVDLDFVEGEGPKLKPVSDRKAVDSLKLEISEHLSPVAEAIKQVREALPQEKALIGFCGAPWTVACYMVEGKSSKGWDKARTLALTQPETFALLIEKLVSASRDYLLMQIEAGADVIQIFDSWAGALSVSEYKKWVIAPTRKLVEEIRKKHPSIPIIGFPRGAGMLYEAYARETKVNVLAIDFQTPMEWASALPVAIQGNLDPILLATDKQAAVTETKRIIEIMRGKPFIFNLGHGIVPQTPPENVLAVCEAIQAGGI